MISLPARQQAAARLAQQQRDTQLAQHRRETQRQGQARNAQRKESPPASASTGQNAAPRSAPRKPPREEDALFSELLNEDDQPLLRPVFNDSGSQQQGFSQLEESSATGAPPAMAMWQEIETDLLAATADRPPGEMMLTLILPKLGQVDARFAALPAGGWDIALHLQPSAWQALLPHQERCRLSLRQRMACRVRLRFERRAAEQQV